MQLTVAQGATFISNQSLLAISENVNELAEADVIPHVIVNRLFCNTLLTRYDSVFINI